jgi:hypothetical protein
MKAIGKIICSYIDKTLHRQYYITIYKEYSILEEFIEFCKKIQLEFEPKADYYVKIEFCPQ